MFHSNRWNVSQKLATVGCSKNCPPAYKFSRFQVVEALAAGPLAGLHMEEADAAVYTLQMARFLQDPEVLNKMLTKIRKVIGLGHEELLNRLEKSSRELFLNAIYMQFADVLPLQWGELSSSPFNCLLVCRLRPCLEPWHSV